MKLSFEKRLEDKEVKYKEKYTNYSAYFRLRKKYQRYVERINFSPFYIFVFLILFLARLINITVLNQNNTIDIYSIIYLITLGVIVIVHLFAFILFHLKHKNLVEKKMSEWDRYLNDSVEGRGL